MALKFGSDEWVKALQDQINTSLAYAEAAKNWEGDFYFVVEPEASVTEPLYMYLDLWHGKCREAFIAHDKSVKTPAFSMSGPYSRWKQIVLKQIDPLQALATGKMKLKGNMVAVMKSVQAAKELVNAATRVDTEFVI